MPFSLLLCRMERSEANSPSVSEPAVMDRDMVQPSGQLAESARSSKNWEHQGKSPRRRRKGTRLQQRGGDHEQLLWEIERRRLPGQHEHLEPSGSASDPAESSPKRCWAAWPCHSNYSVAKHVKRQCLDSFSFHSPFFAQESPLSSWTISSHSLRTQSVHSSKPDVSHVSDAVQTESSFVCTNC